MKPLTSLCEIIIPDEEKNTSQLLQTLIKPLCVEEDSWSNKETNE